MKQLAITAALLLVLLLASFWNARDLKDRGEDLIGALEQAEAYLESGDRTRALSLTERAHAEWGDSERLFLAVLDHDAVDQVSLGFCEVAAYLRQEEPGGEYSAANAALILRIRKMRMNT